MRGPILIAAAVLAGCAAHPPQSTPPAPQRVARETPTIKGQRDLEVLAYFLTGTWDSKPGEAPRRLRVAEFWKGQPVRWFYLEWSRPGADAKPTRQLVFRVAEDGDGKLTTSWHRLAEPSRHAGEWRKAEPFAGSKPADLIPVEECRLATVRTMTAAYTLVTEGKRCPGDLAGAPFMRFEFLVTSSDMDILEQPRDASGNVPPDSNLEPYHFAHMSLEPR